MADSAKYFPVVSELKTLSPFFRARRRTIAFAYGFMFAFVAFTVFLVFTPSSNSASPLFTNIFTSSSSSDTRPFPSLFYYFFPNVSTPQYTKFRRSNPQFSPQGLHNSTAPAPPSPFRPVNSRSDHSAFRFSTAHNASKNSHAGNGKVHKTNQTTIPKSLVKSPAAATATTSKTANPLNSKSKSNPHAVSNSTESSTRTGKVQKSDRTSISALRSPPPPRPVNRTAGSTSNSPADAKSQVKEKGGLVSNLTGSLKKQNDGEKKLLKSLEKCNLFDGKWVRDDSYPLYKPGSCPLIDEQFDCFLNGRPDQDFQKLKWKPKGCTLPRLDGSRMLELLRGKRLVFVGDSLNRNMWESLVCILRNSAKDQSKVFEASGRQYFRTDASYSFIFQDYNCSVEFFVTPFLVQEWEVSNKSGSKKETLRLDMVEKSSDNYKDADFLIFNTGHWWTHEKTSTGKDYYQEGSHVYNELNVIEAFRRALTTWGRWIDANVNPKKSLVFFRGYSASHFSGGQWNSGGQCDSEMEPIKNETYLSEYPPKMSMAERVMKGMKTHVAYMNITRMTDYRKDGHPSIYRKQNLSEEERRSPLRFQDCSHWCLPGVPDAWNELLYAEILVNQLQKQKQQQQQQQKRP